MNVILIVLTASILVIINHDVLAYIDEEKDKAIFKKLIRAFKR